MKLIRFILALITVSGLVFPASAEEGLHRVDTRTLSKLEELVVQAHPLNRKEKDALDRNLSRMLEASFLLSCNGHAGSAVFVGSKGEFVTAAHVVADGTDSCTIRMLRVVGDVVTVLASKNTVEIEAKISTDGHLEDFAFGKISGLKTGTFVEILDRAPRRNDRTLAIGFVAFLKRDPTRDEHWAAVFKARCENLKLTGIEVPRNDFEYGDWISERSCQIAAVQQSTTCFNYDRDVAFLSMSPMISFGRARLIGSTKMIFDNDAAPGMSGGPFFDLASGKLVAIVSMGNGIARNHYIGAIIGSRVKPEYFSGDCRSP